MPKGVTEKKMFGGFCWMLHGNMLCGVEVGCFMLRMGKELEAEALARPGATQMDITGRPIRGLVWIRADEAEGEALGNWIDFAVRFVGTLPHKQVADSGRALVRLKRKNVRERLAAFSSATRP